MKLTTVHLKIDFLGWKNMTDYVVCGQFINMGMLVLTYQIFPSFDDY